MKPAGVAAHPADARVWEEGEKFGGDGQRHDTAALVRGLLVTHWVGVHAFRPVDHR